MKNPIFTALFGSALLLWSCSSKNCDETKNGNHQGSRVYKERQATEDYGTPNDRENSNTNHHHTPTAAVPAAGNDPTIVIKNGHVYHTDANIGKKNAIGNHSTLINSRFNHRDLTHKSMDSLGNYNDIGPTYNNQNGH